MMGTDDRVAALGMEDAPDDLSELVVEALHHPTRTPLITEAVFE